MTSNFNDPNRYGIPGIDDQTDPNAIAAGIAANQRGEDDRGSAQAAAAAGGYAWNNNQVPDLQNAAQRDAAWRQGGGMDYNWLAFNSVPGYQSSNDAINEWMYNGAPKPTFAPNHWAPGPNTINTAQYQNVPGLRAPSLQTVSPNAAPSVGNYQAPGMNPKGAPSLNWQDFDPNVGMTVQQLFEKQYGPDQAYQIWQSQNAANAQSAPSAMPTPAGTTGQPKPAGTTQPAATGKQMAVGFDGKPVDISGMSPEEFAQWKQYNADMAAEVKRQTAFAEQLKLDAQAVQKSIADADKAYKEAMIATQNQQLALQAARDAMDASIRQQGIDLQRKQLALQYRRQPMRSGSLRTIA